VAACLCEPGSRVAARACQISRLYNKPRRSPSEPDAGLTLQVGGRGPVNESVQIKGKVELELDGASGLCESLPLAFGHRYEESRLKLPRRSKGIWFRGLHMSVRDSWKHILHGM
jgi:hypothetical protein